MKETKTVILSVVSVPILSKPYIRTKTYFDSDKIENEMSQFPYGIP